MENNQNINEVEVLNRKPSKKQEYNKQNFEP